MSVFTPDEIAHLQSQRLGRLATARPDDQPHVVPVRFRYNPAQDATEIGGRGGFAKRKKFRDIARTPLVAFVVDDLPPVNPWTARGIVIRGRAGAALNARSGPKRRRSLS